MAAQGDAHNAGKWFNDPRNEGAFAVTEIFVEAFIRASGLNSIASLGDERALVNFLCEALVENIKR
jgi:hypothetical protein